MLLLLSLWWTSGRGQLLPVHSSLQSKDSASHRNTFRPLKTRLPFKKPRAKNTDVSLKATRVPGRLSSRELVSCCPHSTRVRPIMLREFPLLLSERQTPKVTPSSTCFEMLSKTVPCVGNRNVSLFHRFLESLCRSNTILTDCDHPASPRGPESPGPPSGRGDHTR